jgi:hypothetical protein
VVLIDETGLQLSPLRRRTWAAVGLRPFLKQFYGQRKKVSVIGALALSPDRQRHAFHFQTLPDGSFKSVQVAAFLRELLRKIPGKVIVVWDNGSMHKGQAMRDLLAEFPRLSVEWLPPYAPELNPVEQVWSHLKFGELCNYIAGDLQTLDVTASRFMRDIGREPHLLQSYWKATPLFQNDWNIAA